MLTQSQAQSAIKKLTSEIFSLTPNTLIQLWLIDTSTISTDQGFNVASSDNPNNQRRFLFHNSIKLINSSIIWNGETYIPLPIQAGGFEISAKGTLPTPKLTLAVNSEGIGALAILKQQLRDLGDLVGAKITRIRTFAKYLDAVNFNNNPPPGFSPDPLVEFPRDIYYIDRKSNENKFMLEFELASILDIEGVKLPGRLVFANRCPFSYRGEGCCFEFSENRTSIHESAILPDQAPPVATENDELISDIIRPRSITVKGKYNKDLIYNAGDAIYLEKDLVKYYFVCKADNTRTPPPNEINWIQDSCSKTSQGCKLRFGNSGAIIPGNSGLQKGLLRFGGFAGANRIR